jgi:hypothetical protein
MSVINPLHVAQRLDEFREIFKAQPLCIDLGDRRVDDDRFFACVHRDESTQVPGQLGPGPHILSLCERSAPAVSVVKESYAEQEKGVVNRHGASKDPATEFCQVVLTLFGFHKFEIPDYINWRGPAGSSGEYLQYRVGLRKHLRGIL